MTDAAVTDHREAFAQMLRAKRRLRGLSLSELARAAGIAKSNLSRLESGDGNPSLETLWALAAALDIAVSDLIAPGAGNARVVRLGEAVDARADARAEAADYAVTLLSASPVGATRDLYRVTFRPGRPKLSEAHPAGTVEHVVLLSGRARIGPQAAPEILAPGDYLTFPAAQRHVYEALEADATALIVMEKG